MAIEGLTFWPNLCPRQIRMAGKGAEGTTVADSAAVHGRCNCVLQGF